MEILNNWYELLTDELGFDAVEEDAHECAMEEVNNILIEYELMEPNHDRVGYWKKIKYELEQIIKSK